MPIPEDALGAVRTLLKRCTVAITGAAGEHGSGFFIDEHLVLTCAHVVAAPEGSEVTIHIAGPAERTGVVKEYLPGDDVDLAVVEVSWLDDDPPQPAVALDRAFVDNIEYLAVGFPREDLNRTTGLEEIPYKINAHYGADRVTPHVLNIHAGGPKVQPGLSGGGILNPQSGAVVGLVQYTSEVGKDSGGGGIPIVRASEHLATVKEHLDNPPLATRAWRDALGPEAWRELGNEWDWQSRVEIRIAGTVREWSVQALLAVGRPAVARELADTRDSDDEEPYLISGAALTNEITEALFNWARRRRVRDAADVELLGRLLAAALLPDPVVVRLTGAAASDELLVRLLFEEPDDAEEGSSLFDVPWEFVSFRVEDEPRQVATNPGMRFARVASRHDDNKVDLEPGRAPAGVLGIAIQLEEWQAKMPFFTQRLTQKSKDVVWPKHGALAGSLEAAITQNPGVFDALVLDTPSPFRFRTTIQNWEETKQGLSDMEVVHYCGFGEMQDGSPKIALADDEGEEEWRDLEDLYSRVAQSGARVLVVQFLLPMLGTDPVPIPASAFVSALRGGVNAVVFTPVPIHPRQASSFNQTFYDELGRGATVEAAVQTARARVADDRFLNDSASFGWFTLLTGPRSGLRLVDPAAGSAGKFRDATSVSEREH